jgi:integrase/recombinase XerD
MDAYANAYRLSLESKAYAPQSIAYRVASLNHFITWCQARGIVRIEAITRPVLQRYQRQLAHVTGKGGKPLSIATQRNRLTAVRTWFAFLMRENMILYNPASGLELPKPERRLPKHTLTVSEAEQVLMRPDITTLHGLRDRALLEVLYSTGIRRQELIDLRREDVNTSAGVLAIRQGKGKKDRFVPIGERALDWLMRYLAEGRPQLVLRSSPDRVFLDNTGEQWDPNRLSRLVRKYIDQAKLGKSGSCHLFRHTVATLMLENGADIRFIQQMLGHASISTTELYTHVAIHKLKDIHTATHPAAGRHVRAASAPVGSKAELLAALAAEAAEDPD